MSVCVCLCVCVCVESMNFQENPSKGQREPAEKNFVLQAKCP